MARETLLSRAPLPREAIHRIVAEGRTPAQAAREYARIVGPRKDGEPFFDVVLLGIGSDGHTASLFPGARALEERKRWVVPVPHAGHEPFVPRITLTLPALASSNHVCFLVAGEDKSPVVARILGPRARPGPDRPASLVRSAGSVEWYLDASAASGLPSSPP
jgi:6-phosphogluconolactonase